MTELLTPALAGTVAGLGVAMPMGAMSVLLLQEAMRDRRTAVVAAAGIAAVDLGYAALATALGPWVASHVAPVEAWIRLSAAAILLAIAAHGLRGAVREPDPAAPDPVAPDPAAPDPVAPNPTAPGPAAPGPAAPDPTAQDYAAQEPGPAADRGTGRGGARARAFARYVGLTAVNPTTALYFAALTTAQAATLHTAASAAAFLTGVAAASLLWQQTLVAVGALAGRKVPARVRVWTFRLGYGLVAAYAVKVALPLP
ncbi:LysE family transporter [Streptomyces sp. NPDC007369]|uniref:LysE family transporter n=1 Tax=Streptomyces sp. NPDC007369 TaxID=3154589 RepID=UPI0033EBE833